MKSKIFILLIVLLNFSSCSFRESKIHNASDIIPIELSALEEIDPFTSSNKYFNKYRLLRLETKDDCLIKWIEKIVVDENYLFIKDSNHLKGEYLPYCATGFLNLVFKDQKVACNKTDCYAVTYLSDTVYQYTSKDSFCPKYIFNSSLKHVESNTFKEVNSFEIAFEAATLIKKKGFSPGILELYATDELLYFPYYLGIDEYKIYWNIKKQKGYYTKNYINMDPVKCTDNIIASTNDALIRAIPSEELLNARDKYEYTSAEIEILKKIKEEDNPVLVFYFTNNFQ